MGDVIHLFGGSTATGPAKCIECKHMWEAVAPEGTVWLECPNCGLMKGRFYTWYEPSDTHVYECNCGCDLFYIQADGTHMCPSCGTEHRF